MGRSAAHVGISFSTEPKDDRQLVYLGLRQNETSGLTRVATVEGGRKRSGKVAEGVGGWSSDCDRPEQFAARRMVRRVSTNQGHAPRRRNHR